MWIEEWEWEGWVCGLVSEYTLFILTVKSSQCCSMWRMTVKGRGVSESERKTHTDIVIEKKEPNSQWKNMTCKLFFDVKESKAEGDHI